MKIENFNIERITVGEFTLLPIVRTCVSYTQAGTGAIYYGSKSPIGIVIISAGEKRAVNITGEEVPLEQYAEQMPELRKLLES